MLPLPTDQDPSTMLSWSYAILFAAGFLFGYGVAVWVTA